MAFDSSSTSSAMCYLCLQDNPFEIKHSKDFSTEKKKDRLAAIKQILRAAEDNFVCELGEEEVKKLKEEQYKISREF